MNEISSIPADQRMKTYLVKIATGPKMSKDLTELEAEDGLRMVLNGEVSQVRSALFLIAARMKLETVAENIGYWRALDDTTVKQSVSLPCLLQVADAFDGFNRVPYFGFYALPVLAAMGLPAYGHSTLPLPPKFGITFEDLLVNHYRVAADLLFEKRKELIEKFKFGYLSTRQSHPPLESLRDLRVEIVKRPMLATLEKMLLPLKAEKNYLATNYFHPGYEVSMLAVAKLSGFDRVAIGNGMEGGTLFGVHKQGKVFVESGGEQVAEKKLDYESLYDSTTARKIGDAFKALKKIPATRESLAQLGEQALQDGTGPAAPMIAHQAGTLCHLFGILPDLPTATATAWKILNKGTCQNQLMHYVQACR